MTEYFLTIEFLPETGAIKPFELWTHRVDGSRSARLSSFKTLKAALKSRPKATPSAAAIAASAA